MTKIRHTKAKVEEILKHPSYFESATIGGLHYILIEGTHDKQYAKALVSHLHKMGYGARINTSPGRIESRDTYAAGVGGRIVYYVYVRRNKR
jgi:hypothetical protein